MQHSGTISRAAIPPCPPLDASDEVMREARSNCATFARDRGDYALAASYEQGEQDKGWAMRHEVYRLRAMVAITQEAA